MEIQAINKSDGTKIKYISLSHLDGVKYFKSMGYILLPNRNFMTRDQVLVHYNSVMKVWIIED